MVGRRVRSVKDYPACRPTKAQCNSSARKKKGPARISWKKMNKLEQKRKIQELLKSDGWGILSQKMQEEILSAAYQMAENKMLTIDEINFRRGAMFAARRLMELPTNLDMLLDNEILMESSEAELKQQ